MSRILFFTCAMLIFVSCNSDKKDPKMESAESTMEKDSVQIKENPLKDAYFGLYQIGLLQARSCILTGRSSRGSTPSVLAS